jgi:hypothetical protein
MMIEAFFAMILINIFKMPEKKGIYLLNLKEPQPLKVKTINIMMKLLDLTMFSIQIRNINKMLNNLKASGQLNNVIGLSKRGTIRRYNKEEKKLNPGNKLHCEVNTYDIIFKYHNLYTYILLSSYCIFYYTILKLSDLKY